MPHRFSTALSHIILFGTSIYCFKSYNGSGNVEIGGLRLPCVTYGLIAINSLIGVWRWGNPKHGESTDGIYKFTSFLERIFALPLIVTQVLLNLNYQLEVAYAHSGISLIPLVAYLSGNATGLIDVILAVNIVSLGVISLINENYYGVSAAVSYLMDYFYVLHEFEVLKIPAQDFYNYGLSFFCYFALKALGD